MGGLRRPRSITMRSAEATTMTNERPIQETAAPPAGGTATTTAAPESAEIERLRAEIARLEGELAAARRQADEYLAGLQRERAEFLNFKRRTAEEREAMLGLAAEALLSKVLALADDFDRAIETRPADLAGHPWVEGIVAIDRKLRALLESEGVRPIEAGPGTRFDPREHDAIMNVPAADRTEGEIVEEIRRGYRLRDRILRPALVAVAAPPEPATVEPAPEPPAPESEEAGPTDERRSSADEATQPAAQPTQQPKPESPESTESKE
jgi:molecular chaperone GrpE